MTWNDFSDVGFTREDAPLKDTLQFNTPTASSSNTWPSHDEMHRKLKKQPKPIAQFNWDTRPVAGQDWTVEEGFIGCWADLVLSSDWMNRRERTYRDVNWAMVRSDVDSYVQDVS